MYENFKRITIDEIGYYKENTKGWDKIEMTYYKKGGAKCIFLSRNGRILRTFFIEDIKI